MSRYDKPMRFSLEKIGLHLEQCDVASNDSAIKTKADIMLGLIKKRKRTVKELCHILDADEKTISNWIEAMEMKNLLKVETTLLGDWFIVSC